MPETPFSFSVTDWLDRDGGDTLTFAPTPQGRKTLLVASIDDAPDGARVRLAVHQVAFLAAELTKALGLHPSFELASLSSRVSDAATEAMQTATPDPRDELLRRAMTVLWEMPNSMAAENARLRLAIEIAGHLLGLAGEAR